METVSTQHSGGYGDWKDFWEFPSGALTLKEHEEARWLSAHQLDSVNWLPADWGLIQTIAKALRPEDEGAESVPHREENCAIL